MKIIVFGGSGFLGSHVADALADEGHEVTVFDLQASRYLRPDQKMIVGDALDYNAVLKAVTDKDIVYNFAGEADILKSSKNPLMTIQTNLMINANILESCRLAGVKRYIFASTVYVYSQAGGFYRATKQSSELFIECYNKQFNLDFTILRYGSLYGPRSDNNNWIHRVVRQALEEKKVLRRGDGEEIREYIHVTDAARLTVKMIDGKFANQYIMITGQQTMRIKDVLIMLKEMLNNEIEIEYDPASEEGHYEITPYTFQPKFARKLTDNEYVDFGQGLLELINMEHERQSANSLRIVERV